jgi:hypothetical protein
MGVDFAAILSHPFDNSNILSVPERLNANRDLSQVLLRFQVFLARKWNYSGSEEDLAWHWVNGPFNERKGMHPGEIWNSELPPAIDGPRMSVRFGRCTCYVFYLCGYAILRVIRKFKPKHAEFAMRSHGLLVATR